MVCLHGAVHPPAESRLMTEALKSPQDRNKGSRLDREVAFLFGPALVEQSKRVSIKAMAVEAELVAKGARQLREQGGNPDQQRAIIRAMDLDTALALCKWIREPGCMAGVMR